MNFVWPLPRNDRMPPHQLCLQKNVQRDSRKILRSIGSRVLTGITQSSRVGEPPLSDNDQLTWPEGRLPGIDSRVHATSLPYADLMPGIIFAACLSISSYCCRGM